MPKSSDSLLSVLEYFITSQRHFIVEEVVRGNDL